jgi:hypothetical protein
MTDTTCPAQRANLKIAAADLTRDGLPDLSDPAAQRLYSKVVEGADLVIVDYVPLIAKPTGLSKSTVQRKLNDYPADG